MGEKQHWTAVVIGQAAGFLFIDGMEMSSEDVSMVDVNLELRADSIKRHCRTAIDDQRLGSQRAEDTRTERGITSDDFQQEAEFDDEDVGCHRWPLEGH